ncbi:MAG: ABC transporter substrate-binding protein [Clostridia bacterium]|jgi:ABC-type nitrate/sulfonate/bicarbonate transport system substrate-binding protein|nr:ABC transporter substrate-binding protein [Clostridia bacterium]
MKKIKIFTAAILPLFLMAFVSGCSSNAGGQGGKAGEPLTKTAVMLDWSVNTNHTGLYVALEKGYYREQGLDVEILQMGDPGPAQMIAAGQLDFGVSYQEEVTNARAADIPVVSLAAVIQHNTSGFASLKEDNLVRPRDLTGKRYGGWGAPMEHAVISAIMHQDDADAETVEFIDIGAADFFSVIGRQVDFAWIFYAWDGIKSQLESKPLNIIMLKDYAEFLDYYTPTIITSEETIAEKPDLVRKFMAATSQGYEFAIANPQEAAEILLKYAPELDAELVKKSQDWLAAEYQADAPQWGWQDQKVWERYAAWMAEQELLPRMIETEKAFTNEYLP